MALHSPPSSSCIGLGGPLVPSRFQRFQKSTSILVKNAALRGVFSKFYFWVLLISFNKGCFFYLIFFLENIKKYIFRIGISKFMRCPFEFLNFRGSKPVISLKPMEGPKQGTWQSSWRTASVRTSWSPPRTKFARLNISMGTLHI